MINRATDKIYETILELIDKNISNIKILINAGVLEKKSKLRLYLKKRKFSLHTNIPG